ncbi:MAG: exodeoxyribonuclease III [Proteobacteria bacterium]|nr:exodeoxyribonuclease III [Pseudomonadota bacterium]
MKLATWNVNSLNVRLPRLLPWLASEMPDVVCLQETKLEDAKFPHDVLHDAGYEAHFAGQKTYNGVAIVVRHGLAATDIVRGIPGYADTQQRVIAATVDGVRVMSVYVPNGQAVGSDKYVYKLGWCDAARDYFAATLAAHADVAVAGDFNVAPEDRDVHDPASWEGQVLVSEPERAAFRGFLATGLVDSFRLFDQPPGTFSWWDYRMLGFPKNRGLRIDHVLLSKALAPRCTTCRIDRAMRKGEKPSDHAPVIAELA